MNSSKIDNMRTMPTNKLENMDFMLNKSRMKYLLDLYSISNSDLLKWLNNGLKKQILSLDNLNNYLESKEKVKISFIRKIDKFFNKGISWYISKRDISKESSSSIFFRKKKFNSSLNIQSIKVASNFEEKKFDIQNLCSNINFKPKRKINKYSLNDNPRIIAQNIQEQFKFIEDRLIINKVIKKASKEREHLKNFMSIIEDFNVFVFEFIETWNQKEFVQFDGFFMDPNIIVIKKQDYPKREIFTLLHEFAHYLLNIEEIDEVTEKTNNSLSKHERWCNDFVYYFLIGENDKTINLLEEATKENNFHKDKLKNISENSLISISSLYTRLRLLNKIKNESYQTILHEISEKSLTKKYEEKIKNRHNREKLKELGIKSGFAIKPIQSKLFKEIVKLNYFQGNISENRLCNYLKINPNSVGKEIY